MTLPVLGYWNIRGLGAPINYLMEYVGEKYHNEVIEYGSKTGWFDKKDSMGLDFPNVPYYINGNVKLTQSNAMLRYLGRKHNVNAKNEKDAEMQDMVEGVIWDLWLGWIPVTYLDEDKKKYLDERLCPLLRYLEKHLANREYLVGSYITYVDFSFFERLDAFTILYSGLLDNYPSLKNYQERMSTLKGVKEYRSSSRFNNTLNGLVSEWNNV